MNVKSAVNMAKEHVADIFYDENISNLGLEEVEFNDLQGRWIVTIGFSRPWDKNNTLNVALGERLPSRSFKVLQIDDADRRVVSIKDRVLKDMN